MCSSMETRAKNLKKNEEEQTTTQTGQPYPKKKDVVRTHTFAKATNSSRRRDPKEWRCSTQVKNIALFNFKLGLKPNYPDLYYIICSLVTIIYPNPGILIP